MKLPHRWIRDGEEVPNGWVEHSDVLQWLMKFEWTQRFGPGSESDSRHYSFEAGAKQVSFQKNICEVRKRLSHLWHYKGKKWKAFHPISPEELAASRAHKKIYELELPKPMKTEHSLQVSIMPKIFQHERIMPEWALL